MHVGAGLLAALPALLTERHPGRRAVVIADDTVAALHPSPLPGAPLLTFPAGERHKTRETWARLSDRLLELRAGRDTLIVAFGGGVTTDLAGFVAATFLRGVPWLAVPTTTLAMLDAAIGGKTGVDTPAGKNLVGAFHPPSDVVADPAVLGTLPERLFREGLAEAAKHGLTLDTAYGAWMRAEAPRLLARDAEALTMLVRRSAALKGEVVGGDEREVGRRAVLNAGHTVAHALEQVSGYALPHGEAVAIGLVLETRVAEAVGIAETGTADAVIALLTALGLPTALPAPVAIDAVRDAMRVDKKNRDGAVHAALLAAPGVMARRGDGWTHPLDLDQLALLLR